MGMKKGVTKEVKARSTSRYLTLNVLLQQYVKIMAIAKTCFYPSTLRCDKSTCMAGVQPLMLSSLVPVSYLRTPLKSRQEPTVGNGRLWWFLCE